MRLPTLIALGLGLALAAPLQAADKCAACKTQGKHSAARIFRKLDTNGDKTLSPGEFAVRAKKPDKPRKGFEKKDRNSDGQLSLAEFAGKDKDRDRNKASRHGRKDGDRKHAKGGRKNQGEEKRNKAAAVPPAAPAS